ncbi:hypothetical protein JNB71_23580 [Rhizobium herbae]|uniref:Transmembrane protein n=1 Tax=Rhizobium herbae TaxID=508661 RepID=A0ABS7HG81_9HYPH|nr:hypothetical protein [Rhizobium herbae]MBW9066291.1 hypothetical protein [Rhizobium herbae]
MKSVAALLLVFLVSVFAGMFSTLSFASPPDARCTCRNRDGSKLQLGQTACIRVGDMAYLARCEMELNVTTWRKIRDGCPEARFSLNKPSIIP